jgi:toxin-antitoxin system PIN domain toxin
VICLLDVNVLIALLWPAHQSHQKVQQWFAQNARHGWATCPMTEAGFIRIVSNPAFSRRPVSPRDAIAVLSASLAHPAHNFWTEDVSVSDALLQFGGRLLGHQQVTDAYLLALAIRKKGRLVTLDDSLSALLPEQTPSRSSITLL